MAVKPPEYELVEKLRAVFRARCGEVLTMGALSRSFRIMDDNRDRKLSWPEFSMGMGDVCNDGSLTAQEIGMLFHVFDSDGSGTVDQTEFLKGIRGGLNAERKALVHEAFRKLNKSGESKIKKSDMEMKYKGKDIGPMMRALGDRNGDGIIVSA